MFSEFDRRVFAQAFWWHQLQLELQDIGELGYKFHKDADREKCMEYIEKLRQQRVYPHRDEDCTKECKARGLYLQYSHFSLKRLMRLYLLVYGLVDSIGSTN
jgi:hypothetical protein